MLDAARTWSFARHSGPRPDASTITIVRLRHDSLEFAHGPLAAERTVGTEHDSASHQPSAAKYERLALSSVPGGGARLETNAADDCCPSRHGRENRPCLAMDTWDRKRKGRDSAITTLACPRSARDLTPVHRLLPTSPPPVHTYERTGVYLPETDQWTAWVYSAGPGPCTSSVDVRYR